MKEGKIFLLENNNLFTLPNDEPLAARMRPDSLENFAGQEHLIAPGQILRRIIDSDKIPSMIFWGPPGVGKTTLASIIARKTQAEFINFSAVTSGIKEIREIMKQAEYNKNFGARTILFVDESHISIPQIGGMFRGDFNRKSTLSDYGFRLPSCVDNRPLKFEEWDKKLTLAGCIVLKPGIYHHTDGPIGEDTKLALDKLHKQKIVMSDLIFVINKDDYIGNSTQSEIEFATLLDIPVIYCYNKDKELIQNQQILEEIIEE